MSEKLCEGRAVSKAETYEQIADEFSLAPTTRERYLKYMRTRWPDTEDEKQKCLTRYAAEWAIKFNEGVEFIYSDSEGKQILMWMDQ